MKKNKFKMTRRQVLKAGLAGGAGMLLPWRFLPAKAFADAQITGLSNPAAQPMFQEFVPNALNPAFKFQSPNNKYKIAITQLVQTTGLEDSTGNPLSTPIWGYGKNGPGGTWPGMTFEAQSGVPVEVKWENKLLDAAGNPLPHLITSLGGISVVDTSLHWCYSLPGYEQFSIANDGVPVVPHLHGGHTDFQYDGNPEFFFSPGWGVRGPQWVEKKFIYDNSQPAGTLWYHDHALGITRLNVYAGLAGFYILRDDFDTGLVGNPLDLPAYPYEAAFAIQDRMFKDTGELFYPAFPGDPFYADFITDEGADLSGPPFVNGGPTALAEFFGDHMLVNGKIWPKMDVEPRNYRLRLLNGCDSRFLAIEFWEVAADATQIDTNIDTQLSFTVIGSDQGLASSPTIDQTTLLMETGSRYDVIFDFSIVMSGKRVIMKNIGGDEPFGGDIPGPQVFGETDRIMAFDVVLPLDTAVPDVSPTGIKFGSVVTEPTRLRSVALFEGKDEFGRLQPLLGTAEPAADSTGAPINWPNTAVYSSVGLIGQMNGSIAWHSPTTENPALYSTEEWEIWNVTGDAHPVHLHLVHFEILGRDEIKWDSNTIEEGEEVNGIEQEEDRVIPNAKAINPSGDGTYLVTQTTVQHNSVAGNPATYGMGFKIVMPTKGDTDVSPPERADAYVENAPKDMVTALPDQVTRIKATFDKPGRYVWHCHILSHEDHEMMRVLEVTDSEA